MEMEEDVTYAVDVELVEDLYAEGLMFANSHDNLMMYYNSLLSAARLIAEDMEVEATIPFMGVPNVIH